MRYIVNVKYGSVVLPFARGMAQDPDGWWREVMSDYYELDQNGVEVPGSRKPGESFVRIWFGDADAKHKPWWRFWR